MSGLLRRIASRSLGDERGFTLVELMVASSIFVVVAGAVIDAFVAMLETSRVNTLQQDSQQTARQSVIVLSRQLRNLAGPKDNTPAAFAKATDYDVVFRTVNANGSSPAPASNPTNVEWVRYCLDSGSPSAKLWQQVQTLTDDSTAAPSSGSCPAGGWATTRVVAGNVTNRHNSQTGADDQNRPVFLYFDSADLTSINTVRMNLWIDVTPGPKTPAETHLESGVFLRNQNRPPTSSFQATTEGQNGLNLNGSASADPEGQQLTYTWWANGAKIANCTGVVCDWNAGAAGQYTIRLDTFDPAGLSATSSQRVQVG